MIDLSNLTTKELHELSKKIAIEKKKREGHTKAEVFVPRTREVWDTVEKLINEKFPEVETREDKQDDNGEYFASKELMRVGDSVSVAATKLCDVAFMNYRLNKIKDGIFCSGSDLYEVGDKFESYRRMYNELIDIFIKYSKEEK